LEEKEFRTWFFDRDALKPYIDEMLDAKNSPLILAPVQQQERFRVVVERAIEELFGGEMGRSWVRRLEEMAYFLHETGRPEQGKLALAAALALAASSRGGRDIGICEQLVRTGLAAFLQVEEERQAEESRTSLILTPQQAAREAQQRRR
jgi:Mrp family chromosome partitioning ATPase